MIEGCQNAHAGCPYYQRRPRGPLRGKQYNGCFSDTDHTVPQRLARRAGATALERAYIYSEVNLVQMCRNEHDAKTEQGDQPLPDIWTMVWALTVPFEGEHAQPKMVRG